MRSRFVAHIKQRSVVCLPDEAQFGRHLQDGSRGGRNAGEQSEAMLGQSTAEIVIPPRSVELDGLQLIGCGPVGPGSAKVCCQSWLGRSECRSIGWRPNLDRDKALMGCRSVSGSDGHGHQSGLQVRVRRRERRRRPHPAGQLVDTDQMLVVVGVPALIATTGVSQPHGIGRRSADHRGNNGPEVINRWSRAAGHLAGVIPPAQRDGVASVSSGDEGI